MRPQPINPSTRTEALNALENHSRENPLDLLVIGGGVVGAAAAFDASTRGLRTGLIEARDLAQGTSSRSSGLVHGGLRYLQMLDFKLVAEALRERNLLLTQLAPHLVRGLPFIFPFKRRVVDRAFIGSGVSLYDILSFASMVRTRRGSAGPGGVPVHRHFSRRRLQARFPGLDRQKFIGALEYFDAQVDDARLVLTLARSAHSLGAQVATRTEFVEYIFDEVESSEPVVLGASIRDRLTGRRISVYAKETIMAAGVWSGLQKQVAGNLKMLASKGIHITVPKDRIAADAGVGVITQTEKSVLFIIPRGRYWAIGTTDTAWKEAVDLPAPTSQDINYLLANVNKVLRCTLSREDVIGSWAGLRPLLQPDDTAESATSSKVSREHTVTRLASGLSAVGGGKLTTYRSMAEDAVDFAIGTAAKDRRSLTDRLPILGGQGYREWVGRTKEVEHQYGFSQETVERLLSRYGSLIQEVLELINQRADLADEVSGAAGYLRVEFVYAVRFEGALHLEDLLERRTHLFYEVADRGLAALEEIAHLVKDDLGWDAEQVAGEIESYTSYIAAYRAAERSSSDQEAAAAMRQVLPAEPEFSDSYRGETYTSDSETPTHTATSEEGDV